jgi:hypothetical protein
MTQDNGHPGNRPPLFVADDTANLGGRLRGACGRRCEDADQEDRRTGVKTLPKHDGHV